MDYKKIVAEAWHFTQERKEYIFWYGAVPSFFSTLVGIGYIFYQYFAFISSRLFQNWPKSFLSILAEQVLAYFKSNTQIIVPFTIVAVVGVILYFIVPVICEGALIQSVARRRNGQQIRLRHGFTYGLRCFLPLFEYNLLLRTFSIWSVFSLMSSMLRNFGWQVLNFAIPVMIVVFIAALALAMVMVYSAFFVVIDGTRVIQSVSKSMDLVIKHLEETILLTILMLFIGLRIIVQVLFVFLIPALAVGVVYIFTAINLPGLAWFMAGGISLIALFVASYLNGTIHVFAVTVWTFTFLKLTSTEEISPRAVVVDGQTVTLAEPRAIEKEAAAEKSEEESADETEES